MSVICPKLFEQGFEAVMDINGIYAGAGEQSAGLDFGVDKMRAGHQVQIFHFYKFDVAFEAGTGG